MFDIAAWQVGERDNLEETSCGEEVRGIHKLVQRVCAALLQEHETVKYSFGKRIRPGCDFMTTLRHGEIRSEADVSAHFFLARHMIFAELKSSVHATDPREERFRDVQYQGIVIQPGSIKLKLQICSQTDEITVWLSIAMAK